MDFSEHPENRQQVVDDYGEVAIRQQTVDELPEDTTGIVINPYSGRQALVWVNPILIRLVIKNTMKTLENRQIEKE